jgi:hypothetical protein
MNAYSNLEIHQFYLVQEEEDAEITLIQPLLETDHCFFILQHGELENTFWKKKTDPIYEIIEQLTDEQAEDFQNIWEEDDENDFM